MEILEKVVWVLAGLAVLAVGAFAVLQPHGLQSEVSKEAVDFAWEQANQGRPKTNRPDVPMPGRIVQAPVAPVSGPGVAPAALPGRAPLPGGRGTLGPRVVPQGPSFAPGPVVEQAPINIPDVMVQKYQHIEDVREAGMTASGHTVTLPDGTYGYTLDGMAEDSPLAKVGLSSGITLISINGERFREDPRSSISYQNELYQKFKDAKTLTIVYLRDGQTMSQSVNVGGR